jgi:hypothetical protein
MDMTTRLGDDPRFLGREPLAARRRPRLFFLFLLVVGVVLTGAAAEAQVWVGVGYDGISQAYYLETIDTTLVSPDSLDQLRLTATAINEGQVFLRTRIGSKLSWDQTTAATSLYWHHRSLVAARTSRLRPTWTFVEYRLDLKYPHRSTDTSPFANFRVHEFHGEVGRRFGRSSLRFIGRGEFVFYPDPQELAYDYRQFRGELRFSHIDDPVHYRQAGIRFLRREVPDSSRITYLEAGGQLGLGWSIGWWRLQASLEGVRRTYDVPEAGLDHNVLRLYANWSDDGVRALWPGLLEVEVWDYRSALSVLEDYMRVDLRQRRFLPLAGSWTPFVEPGLEAVFSRADEGYLEPRAVVGTEFFRAEGWWANVDLGLGYRDYEDPVLTGMTDHWRFAINVMVDGPIWPRVRFNLLYTQDWEWHAAVTDNITVVLLSAGVKYRF